MWYSRKTKRQLLEALYKLFDKHGPQNVTLKQARQAAKKIQANLTIDKDRLCGYRGAYAKKVKREKRERASIARRKKKKRSR